MIAVAALSQSWSAFAGKAEPLDVDFLDYLASCEGKRDNWTVIAAERQRPKPEKESPRAKTPAEKPAPKPEEKS